MLHMLQTIHTKYNFVADISTTELQSIKMDTSIYQAKIKYLLKRNCNVRHIKSQTTSENYTSDLTYFVT